MGDANLSCCRAAELGLAGCSVAGMAGWCLSWYGWVDVWLGMVLVRGPGPKQSCFGLHGA